MLNKTIKIKALKNVCATLPFNLFSTHHLKDMGNHFY